MDLLGLSGSQRNLLEYVVYFLLLPMNMQYAECKTVSQCHGRQATFTFVSLYCGFKKVIQIQRAFHGNHKNSDLAHCGYLEEDCTMDTTHSYDWSECEGRHSCVQMIQPRDMVDCTHKVMTYLQVHYACVPGTAYIPPIRHTPPPPPPMLRPIHREPANEISQFPPRDYNMPRKFLPDIIQGPPPSTTTTEQTRSKPVTQPQESGSSICRNRTWTEVETHVSSPGYPQFYPIDTECRCVVKGPDGSKISVTYEDLSLVMRAGQCVDWLLLQSLGYKNSAAVTCGQMLGKERTLLAKGNWLLMHFHTARGATGEHDDVRHMAGFKVKVKTVPKGPFEIQCYPAPSEVLQTLKYKDAQRDINNNTLLPQFDLESLPSRGSSATTTHYTAMMTLTLVLVSFVS